LYGLGSWVATISRLSSYPAIPLLLLTLYQFTTTIMLEDENVTPTKKVR